MAISEKRLLAERLPGMHSVRRGLLGRLHWENFDWLNRFAEWVIKAAGLYGRGYRNVLDLRLERVELDVRRLPAAFEGFRMLWISDLHIERFEQLAERTLSIAQSCEYDLCVLGGDCCFDHFITDKARGLMEKIARGLVSKGPVVAVFGNHDYSPMVRVLEGAGVRMLLNEHYCLQRGREKLYLVGIDDCHYFGADDLDAAIAGIEPGSCRILLSHSPEIYKKAAAAGMDACLSGHTHGGQICLPGGLTLISSASVPRQILKGKWEYNGMAGYTSRGAGASGAAVRFNCPSEITLFTFKRSDSVLRDMNCG